MHHNHANVLSEMHLIVLGSLLKVLVFTSNPVKWKPQLRDGVPGKVDRAVSPIHVLQQQYLLIRIPFPVQIALLS